MQVWQLRRCNLSHTISDHCSLTCFHLLRRYESNWLDNYKSVCTDQHTKNLLAVISERRMHTADFQSSEFHLPVCWWCPSSKNVATICFSSATQTRTLLPTSCLMTSTLGSIWAVRTWRIRLQGMIFVYVSICQLDSYGRGAPFFQPFQICWIWDKRDNSAHTPQPAQSITSRQG